MIHALLIPVAIGLIGLGVLLGVNPLPSVPRAGWICVLFGTILAGVAVLLVFVEA